MTTVALILAAWCALSLMFGATWTLASLTRKDHR